MIRVAIWASSTRLNPARKMRVRKVKQKKKGKIERTQNFETPNPKIISKPIVLET